MKIRNIKDPKGFFEKLKECKGTLEIVTPQGDRLNLKSKLSQYIIMRRYVQRCYYWRPRAYCFRT